MSTRIDELDNARLGVLYFLGNLRCDLSPEESVSELKKASQMLKGKISDSKLDKLGIVAGGIDHVSNAVQSEVDAIAKAIETWLAEKFKFSASDVELAVQHVRHNLPAVVTGIRGDIEGLGKGGGAPGVGDFKGIAKGLYTGVSKAIEFYELKQKKTDVVLESGHPDLVANAITRAVGRSALVGLAEAALAGAKLALAAFTAGVGEIINLVAGVIERILRFAVRFCDALNLRKAFAAAKEQFDKSKLGSAIHNDADGFADWFKKVIERSPIVAALVMNCGIAGDAMRFLKVTTGADGKLIMVKGQFDKGVTYLNALKSASGSIILAYQEEMRISSNDKMVASLLKHAGEIGLIQKEANSSWRAWLYEKMNSGGTKAKLAKTAADKAGLKQSTVLAHVSTRPGS